MDLNRKAIVAVVAVAWQDGGAVESGVVVDAVDAAAAAVPDRLLPHHGCWGLD